MTVPREDALAGLTIGCIVLVLGTAGGCVAAVIVLCARALFGF